MKLDYVMDPYIPEGLTTVISGKGGCGKGTLSLSIASALTNGINLFTGKTIPQGRVLLINTNEDPPKQLGMRLNDFGTNMNNLFHSKIKDVSDLHMLAKEVKNNLPQMVIVDSLIGLIGTVSSMSKVQRTLATIQELASEYNFSPIIIHHTVKNPKSADDWSGGTARISTFARQGYFMHKEGNTVYFSVAKYQYGKFPDGFKFTITDDGTIEDIEYSNYSVEDLIKGRLSGSANATNANTRTINANKDDILYGFDNGFGVVKLAQMYQVNPVEISAFLKANNRIVKRGRPRILNAI